ncbi:MAG: hypothetical protein ABIO19_15060 [Burkholderiaceae bacterium]
MGKRILLIQGHPDGSISVSANRAHSIKSLERNILGFVGIAPVSATLIGMAGNLTPVTAKKMASQAGEAGRAGRLMNKFE